MSVAEPGFDTRWAASFAAYSSASPACRWLAMTVWRPSRVSESVLKRRAGSSNSIAWARSSVVRLIREARLTTMMPATNRPKMAIPSGFSRTFSNSA